MLLSLSMGLMLLATPVRVGDVLHAAPKKKAAPKKVEAPPPATSPELFAALDHLQPAVGQCVVNGQPENGAWTQVLTVKLTLTGAGQVFAADLSFEPANEKSDEVHACVDKVLRSFEWPRTPAPLVVVQRDWTFKME